MRKKNWRWLLSAGTALLFFGAGCTELERRGYSAIPQNSPAGWEMTPYGDLQN